MSKKDNIRGLLNQNSNRPAQNNPAKQALTEDQNTDVHTYVQRTVKKATFELDSDLHKWLKLYSVNTGRNMVDVVEEVLQEFRRSKE